MTRTLSIYQAILLLELQSSGSVERVASSTAAAFHKLQWDDLIEKGYVEECPEYISHSGWCPTAKGETWLEAALSTPEPTPRTVWDIPK